MLDLISKAGLPIGTELGIGRALAEEVNRRCARFTDYAAVGLTRVLALDYSHTCVRFDVTCSGRLKRRQLGV